MSINFISADGFAAKVADGAQLSIIDVRTEAEFAACHVEGAKLFPLQTLDPKQIVAQSGAALSTSFAKGERAQKPQQSEL